MSARVFDCKIESRKTLEPALGDDHLRRYISISLGISTSSHLLPILCRTDVQMSLAVRGRVISCAYRGADGQTLMTILELLPAMMPRLDAVLWLIS